MDFRQFPEYNLFRLTYVIELFNTLNPMKALSAVLAISLFILCCGAQEPSATQPTAETSKASRVSKNYLYLSPFNLIASHFLLGYEHDFGRRHGILFMPGAVVGGYNDYYYSGNNGTDWALTTELQYRYRIVSVTNPRGKAKNPFRFDFYVAPFANYQYFNYYGEDYYYDTTGTYLIEDRGQTHAGSGGVLFGMRFTFFERFSLDTYMGGGMKFSSDRSSGGYYYEILKPDYTGIIGKANLQIGVAF